MSVSEACDSANNSSIDTSDNVSSEKLSPIKSTNTEAIENISNNSPISANSSVNISLNDSCSDVSETATEADVTKAAVTDIDATDKMKLIEDNLEKAEIINVEK